MISTFSVGIPVLNRLVNPILKLIFRAKDIKEIKFPSNYIGLSEKLLVFDLKDNRWRIAELEGPDLSNWLPVGAPLVASAGKTTYVFGGVRPKGKNNESESFVWAFDELPEPENPPSDDWKEYDVVVAPGHTTLVGGSLSGTDQEKAEMNTDQKIEALKVIRKQRNLVDSNKKKWQKRKLEIGDESIVGSENELTAVFEGRVASKYKEQSEQPQAEKPQPEQPQPEPEQPEPRSSSKKEQIILTHHFNITFRTCN